MVGSIDGHPPVTIHAIGHYPCDKAENHIFLKRQSEYQATQMLTGASTCIPAIKLYW